jgi:hypothetical protein
MILATRTLEIRDIRLDGGTQVRETLNEEWIAELMILYEEGGHDIPPVDVVIDDDGACWLFNGFHRIEAKKRVGHSGVNAQVLQGTLDLARYRAASANKNGYPRTAGDKKRAVLLAVSTNDGKKMGFRELGRHCGVHESYVREVLGAGYHAPRTRSAASPRKSVEVLWTRVDAALQADPARPDSEIQREIGCDIGVVYKRRAALGLPKSDPKRWKSTPSKSKAAELLQANPDRSDREIAKESGATPRTVSALRVEERPRPKAAEPTPSAPKRKSGDPRDGADDKVVPIRRREESRARVDSTIAAVMALAPGERVSVVAQLHELAPEAFAGLALISTRRDGS